MNYMILSIIISILFVAFIVVIYKHTKTDFEDKESEERDKYYDNILKK